MRVTSRLSTSRLSRLAMSERYSPRWGYSRSLYLPARISSAIVSSQAVSSASYRRGKALRVLGTMRSSPFGGQPHAVIPFRQPQRAADRCDLHAGLQPGVQPVRPGAVRLPHEMLDLRAVLGD